MWGGTPVGIVIPPVLKPASEEGKRTKIIVLEMQPIRSNIFAYARIMKR